MSRTWLLTKERIPLCLQAPDPHVYHILENPLEVSTFTIDSDLLMPNKYIALSIPLFYSPFLVAEATNLSVK